MSEINAKSQSNLVRWGKAMSSPSSNHIQSSEHE